MTISFTASFDVCVSLFKFSCQCYVVFVQLISIKSCDIVGKLDKQHDQILYLHGLFILIRKLLTSLK